MVIGLNFIVDFYSVISSKIICFVAADVEYGSRVCAGFTADLTVSARFYEILRLAVLILCFIGGRAGYFSVVIV